MRSKQYLILCLCVIVFSHLCLLKSIDIHLFKFFLQSQEPSNEKISNAKVNSVVVSIGMVRF